MTRRDLFAIAMAAALPRQLISTDLPSWVVAPGSPCPGCGGNGGAEGTVYCAGCLGAKRVERVRDMPMAGDVLFGPGGARTIRWALQDKDADR